AAFLPESKLPLLVGEVVPAPDPLRSLPRVQLWDDGPQRCAPPDGEGRTVPMRGAHAAGGNQTAAVRLRRGTVFGAANRTERARGGRGELHEISGAHPLPLLVEGAPVGSAVHVRGEGEGFALEYFCEREDRLLATGGGTADREGPRPPGFPR